jgi:hypothetical protein
VKSSDSPNENKKHACFVLFGRFFPSTHNIAGRTMSSAPSHVRPFISNRIMAYSCCLFFVDMIA